jgi:deoxyribose-phosphate aldolase
MPAPIARLIDHALLHPTLTTAELIEGCELAVRLGVASVCIKPYAVPLAVERVAGSGVAVCTVIGFPHGSHASETKQFEAELALAAGATELDMVVNIGKVLEKDWDYVATDIRGVVVVAHRRGALVKVIFENEYLAADELKIELCRISSRSGADFVKTSTGFGYVPRENGGYATIGATDHDLRLMRAHAAPTVGVKASGGIRTYADAQRVVQLGATRIGTSSTAAIVAGERGGPTGPAGETGY